MGEIDEIKTADKSICTKEVIITKLAKRGSGQNNLSMVRTITQVWEKDGDLIAEHDPAPDTFSISQMVTFASWCIYNEIQQVNITDLEEWFSLNHRCETQD